jgi:hypothetical protein
MTPEEVAMSLKLMQSAWGPRFPVESYTAHVWAEACHGIDGQDALTAAKRLIKSEDFPPSIARFIEECKLVKRNHGPALTAGAADAPMTSDAWMTHVNAARAELVAAEERMAARKLADG